MMVTGNPSHYQIIKNKEINGNALKLHEILNSQTWPIISTPTSNNIWFMGLKHFCQVGLEDSSVVKNNFYCNNTKFTLNAT